MKSNLAELTKLYDSLAKLNFDKVPPHILDTKLDVLYEEFIKLGDVAIYMSHTALHELDKLDTWVDLVEYEEEEEDEYGMLIEVAEMKVKSVWTREDQVEYINLISTYSSKLTEAYCKFLDLLCLNESLSDEK